MLLIFRSTCK